MPPKKEVKKIPNVGQRAWGGIGGVGKHPADNYAAEISALTHPDVQAALKNKAWGGIGGVGKHDAGMEPEIEK